MFLQGEGRQCWSGSVLPPSVHYAFYDWSTKDEMNKLNRTVDINVFSLLIFTFRESRTVDRAGNRVEVG